MNLCRSMPVTQAAPELQALVYDILPPVRCRKVMLGVKLQALVYDILPSTTAVFSYAIGSRKLSANEQCFVGAQTVVNLLETTQINWQSLEKGAGKRCSECGDYPAHSLLDDPGTVHAVCARHPITQSQVALAHCLGSHSSSFSRSQSSYAKTGQQKCTHMK